VASRPKKTYAEDELFAAAEERDGGLGRVVEDRRFGIYDVRRYRAPGENGDGEEEVDGAEAAVTVVKAYRDSATFKRRHGLPLAAAGDASDGAEPAQLPAPEGRRKRTAAEAAGLGRRGGTGGGEGPATGVVVASRSGRIVVEPRALADSARAPASKRQRSSTRFGVGRAQPAPPALTARTALPPLADDRPGTEDPSIWRLQFERGWGNHGVRTVLKDAGEAAGELGLSEEAERGEAGLRAHRGRGLAQPWASAVADGLDGGDDALLEVPWLQQE